MHRRIVLIIWQVAISKTTERQNTSHVPLLNERQSELVGRLCRTSAGNSAMCPGSSSCLADRPTLAGTANCEQIRQYLAM